ncbi:MAG: type II toxin-antitoxin system RelE/ParE family toxin [Ideonella sp.]|nr:type II toxin-antitoxin system RelE/ParE family toxin [Ideonella sp.]MCC7459620.1 type II toxin-antitoxin system RelE/ParE family toxin [Nitrospira sp.]
MARIELSPRAIDDLDRILAHLVEHGVADAGERVADIVAALDVLERNPMIGRPAEPGLRELVIGRGSRGYVALYAYAADRERVRIVAVRGQREAGY